jgi:hypothetical protein
MEAFTLVQIAAAVFGGNLLTLMLVKGYQIIERDERERGEATWWRYFVPVVPLALFALVVIGSTS